MENRVVPSPAIIKKIILPLLLVVITLAVYGNSFNGPFVFDDSRIYNNPHIRISELTVDNLLEAGLQSEPKTRPVANLSFALNYYFNGYRVKGYHLVNLLIHISCGILFYFLAAFFVKGRAGFLPFIAALIWLVHPIQTQPVLYIVQRMTELAAMFYLAAFLCYIYGRQGPGRWRIPLLIASFFFGLLAIGSKENAVTLPFFLLLYELYFGRNFIGRIKSRRFVTTGFVTTVLAIILCVTALIYLYLGPHPLRAVLKYSGRDFSLGQRLLTESRVVLFYISLLLLPHPSRLNLNHDFPISLSILTPPTTLLAIMAITALLLTALFIAKKERLISFAILWFLGNLVIESTVIPLELVFEHRLYLPSLFVILAIVVVAYRFIDDKKTFYVIFLGTATLFAVWSYQRIQVWQDEISFWSDCYRKSPRSVRSANSLALSYERAGDYKKMEDILAAALEIDPDAYIVLANLGSLFRKQNNLQAAEPLLLRALALKDDFPQALFNLAIIRQSQGRVEEAENIYLRLIKKDPNFSETQKIYDLLGRFREDKGDPVKALEYYRAALKVAPNFAAAHNDIGILYAKRGNKGKAMQHFQRALEIDRNFTDARINLRKAMRLQGE